MPNLRPGRKKTEELISKMTEMGLDALVFVNNEPLLDTNIAYLTGFRGMLNGALVFTPDGTTLITTGLDYSRAEKEAEADEIVKIPSSSGFYKFLGSKIKGYKKLGVIKNLFSVEMAEKMRLKLAALEDVKPIMSKLRSVKTEGEIEAIRKAGRICNKGLDIISGMLAREVTETEIAAELESELKKSGSEHLAFETIVTSGKRSALVHPAPPASQKAVGRGLGLVDFGAVYDGYSTDVTVPFALGKINAKEEILIETVISVWDELRNLLKHGTKTSNLHDIYVNHMKRGGLEVRHSLGHGVGMDVHEYPSLSSPESMLEEGMVVAVEPGAYLDGVGGCRLENTILIKRNGYEMLTKSKLIRM